MKLKCCFCHKKIAESNVLNGFGFCCDWEHFKTFSQKRVNGYDFFCHNYPVLVSFAYKGNKLILEMDGIHNVEAMMRFIKMLSFA